MASIWKKRYSTEEAAESLTRQVRKQGTYYPYTRPTLGWKLSCELDSGKLSRQEVFDQILERQLKSQEPEMGVQEKGFIMGVFVISAALLALMIFVSCMSAWKKAPDEDDGFWENYDHYWRTHVIITICVFCTALLSIPVTLEYVFVMLETL